MRITGLLVSVEHATGTMKDRETGDPFTWENATVRVFDGREVTVVKCKGESIAPAMGLKNREGQSVAFDVDSPRQVETRSFHVAEQPKG